MQTSPERVGEPLLLYLCYVPNPLKAAANEGCGLPMDFGIFTTDKFAQDPADMDKCSVGSGEHLMGSNKRTSSEQASQR